MHWFLCNFFLLLCCIFIQYLLKHQEKTDFLQISVNKIDHVKGSLSVKTKKIRIFSSKNRIQPVIVLLQLTKIYPYFFHFSEDFLLVCVCACACQLKKFNLSGRTWVRSLMMTHCIVLHCQPTRKKCTITTPKNTIFK